VIISQTPESLRRISETITRGGVIAFRTDTFYGLGADPFNREAVRTIKQIKGREGDKPILIVISELDQTGRLINDETRSFHQLAEKFWPGPLTLIGKAAPMVPEEITAGTGTVGVRLPGDDKVRALIRECGGTLTATSANPSHKPPAKTAQEVYQYFGEKIELIVDGGRAQTDQPSTVVDVSGVEPGLIREGVIAWAEIQAAFVRG
jgi:L-threonylcarbamoyladenylate synthase